MAPAAPRTPPDELLARLAGLRRAFRDVAAVVEAVGALRSLGSEDALIEMAMFAQSHEQTVERAWTALAACEDAARRVCDASLAASLASDSAAPASLAPDSLAPPPSLAPRASAPPSEADAALATDPAPVLPMELGSELPDARPPAAEPQAARPRPADGEGAPAADEDGPVTQVDAPTSRVLVVDDDPAVLRAFRRVLQAEHEIVRARAGSEALQIVLSGARVDAIICDIGMPKLDGPAFFSELFELRPQLMPRVVFCTGGLPNEKTQRFLERLQAPLLYKPVAASDLQRAIDVARAR